MPESWKALYDHHAMSVYALVVLPALFLGRLTRGFAATAGVEPYAAGFVRVWAVVFALVAILDPVATGLLGWPLLPFVLLGDYRVFALVLVVAQPGRARAAALGEAAAWMVVVPLVSYGIVRALTALRGPQPDVVLWIAYETAFAVLAAWFVVRVVAARVGFERAPVRRYLRTVLGVVVGYYVLWLVSDLLVVSGHEWGWGLRVVPNLLYYGVLVPFAYATFFGGRAALASTSTQAAR